MAQILSDSQVVTIFDGNVVADTVSDEYNRALYGEHTLHFKSAGLGTLLVEGSIDGTNWVTIDASVDPNTAITITQKFNWFRVTRDNTTDAVTVVMGGYLPHY